MTTGAPATAPVAGPAPTPAPVVFDFDRTFQRKIVLLTLRDTTFCQRTDGLIKPEYFESELDEAVIAVGLDFYKNYKKAIDLGSLPVIFKKAVDSKRFRNDLLPELKLFLRAGWKLPIEDREFVIDMVADFAKKQAMTQAILSSVPLIEKRDYDKIKSLMSAALAVGANDDGSEYDYLAEIESRTATRIALEAGTIKPSGITTGYTQIDKHLHHEGWGRGELSALMARAKWGKCVTRDTLLLTEDGLVDIGYYIPSSLVGDSFGAHDMAILGRNGLERTSHVYNNGLSKTLRITTCKGLRIEGTYNHPMLVIDQEGNLNWRKLGELKIGDQLAVQRGGMVFGHHIDLAYAIKAAEDRRASSARPANIGDIRLPALMTPDLARFIAMITAEAHLSDGDSQIAFTQKCPKIMAQYCELANKLFGLTLSPMRVGRASVVQFCSVILRAYLEALGVEWTTSAGKTIPIAIRRAPKGCFAAFLNVVLGLEGSVPSRGGKTVVFEITMASERLMRQMQIALLNFGIVSSLRMKMACATNGLRIVRPYWRIRIQGARNIEKLRDRVGLIEQRKQKALERCVLVDSTARDWIPNARAKVKQILRDISELMLDRGKRNMLLTIARGERGGGRELTYAMAETLREFLDANDVESDAANWLRETVRLGYAFDPILKIEENEAETVDLTVPKTHSFFANGLIGHNSMGIGDFAKNAWLAGYNVLVCSCEVSALIYSDRLDASISDTVMKMLRKTPHDVKRKIDLLKTKSHGEFKVHDFASGTLKPSQLRRLIERYRMRGIMFDLICVDYADIMCPERYTDSPIENSKSIWIDLRAIAYEQNAAMLTATQTNRDGAKAMVAKATDVADDYNKVRTADLLISGNANEAEIASGEARLVFVASRNQAEITVTIRQERAKMRFLVKILSIIEST